jgi:formylglycine-generating enzyme required for sulfatase activity/predicted dienelactone hydrolase
LRSSFALLRETALSVCHEKRLGGVTQLRSPAISNVGEHLFVRQRISSLLSIIITFTLLLSASHLAAGAGLSDNSMALISGATFRMGTDAADIARLQQIFGVKRAELFSAEVPRHTVTLDSFYLDKHEVTNAQFKKFIDRHPEWRRERIPARYHNGNYLKDWNGDNFPKEQSERPVTNVSWYAAVAFCQAEEKRLPTEAEWEYAARGGLSDKQFPWGDEPADKTRANYLGSKLKATAAVESYPANGYGLFEMAGNVWEFMADEWGAYPASAQVNPVAGGNFFTDDSFTAVTTRRVIRGGSFGGSPVNLRVTYRDSHPPDGAREFVGFRCAKSVKVSDETQFKVGMVTRNFTDEKRKNWQGTSPRPLRTAVWYPADAVTDEETIFGGAPDKEVFAPVTVAAGAELSRASKKYPLVLLSHGTGGSAVQMMWLGYYLAAHGYIVAAINHHGNTASEKEPAAQGFLLYWERARDLTATLDKLLADPVFGEHIDRQRIGAAGFSLGGYTVISLAGGVFSPQEFESFCRSPQRDFTCEPQAEFPDAPRLFAEFKKTDAVVQESLRHASDSYRDVRIKRVFAIAPALGGGFTKAGLSQIKIPVRIVIGQADKVAPLATNARRYAKLIKRATLTILPGSVGHYTFLAECNPHGKTILDICRDAEGVDRATVHRQVAQLAFEFFEQGRTNK